MYYVSYKFKVCNFNNLELAMPKVLQYISRHDEQLHLTMLAE